ncbi:MAG TPA: hypothetical protein VF062_22425 [Candidatus Limnocylindrales bacterium]
MTKISRITGTITLTDGSTSEFSIATDGGWQQWGAEPFRLAETVDALEALTRALFEDDLLASEDDEQEPDEDEPLEWEDAGTDEPGDQNADSRLYRYAYWSIGPDGSADRWSVELISRDEDMNEKENESVHLGHFDTEEQAKAAAQEYERSGNEQDPGEYDDGETDMPSDFPPRVTVVELPEVDR